GEWTKWPTVRQFTSWLGLCPNWKKTGGKVQSSQTRKGKNRAASALRLAAWSLMRSHSYLGAYLRRQRARLGAPKAITATAHKLARIIYNLLRCGVAYMKQEEAAYAEQVRHRQEQQLQRRGEAGGSGWAQGAQGGEGRRGPRAAEGPTGGVGGRPAPWRARSEPFTATYPPPGGVGARRGRHPGQRYVLSPGRRQRKFLGRRAFARAAGPTEPPWPET